MKVHALLPFLPSMVDWLMMLGNNHSVMPGPAFIPVTGVVVTCVGTEADAGLGLTCDDVVAADVGAGVGTGSVDVDAEWQDGVIEGLVEPEEDTCPEVEE